MTVKNTGFLLDRLGQDCHPLQFLRELTQNAIEAVKRTGKPGQVVWDVDWTSLEQSGSGVMKLCVIDSGDGMTGAEMVEHINKLSSSGAEQSLSGNYGVGAKIAAATRNHEGLIYLSWKRGQGSMIHLWRNPEDGTYGLRQQQRADGTYCDFLEIDDAIKPDIIGDHGTMIVLLGNSPEANTIDAPPNAAGPSRWMAKYLNSRYFRFPDGVTIKCREGWNFQRSDKDRNLVRTLHGQERYLQEHAEAKGSVELEPNAAAHWWILKDEPALTNNSGFIESSGHAAALYQDELYEMSTGRSGTARLQQFGVIFGMRQVVIYIQPHSKAESKLTTNTARTTLLVNNEQLPWSDWAADFREKMPTELESFIQEKASASENPDHSKSIRERLKPLLDMFKISRYRPHRFGELQLDDEASVRGGRPRTGQGQGTPGEANGKGSNKRGGILGNIYSMFEKRNGTPAEKVQPDPFPRVNWVCLSDGTREPNFLEDRAAKFIEDQNLLLINADFRVFSDMVNKWHKEFGGGEAVKKTVADVVRNWFEQSLVETVMGVQALKGSREWTMQNIQDALSEEAMTAAVMQRYHVNNNVKRELGAKLGKHQIA
jgi:hypothetical protein